MTVRPVGGANGSLNGYLRAVSESLDLGHVLQQVLRASRAILGTDRHLIVLRDRAGDLVPRAWDGFAPASLLADPREWTAHVTLAAALEARAPLALAADGAVGAEPASPWAQVRAGLVAPLRIGDRVLGILLVGASAPRAFSPADHDLLRELADYAAIAIEHAQRFDEATMRGERLATLVELTQRIAGHRPYDELLQVIAEEARQLVGATAATCRLVEADELATAVCAGEDTAAVTGAPRRKIGEGLCGLVAARKNPVRVGDVREEAARGVAGCRDLAARGIRAYLGVPLVVRDAVAGVLSVYSTESDRFTEDDLALLTRFAGQATVSVENARLVEELLHTERLAAVGRIVAGVAHELNNPLAVVIGTADLLRREGVEGHVDERLRRIAGQAQRAVKIVRSLLTLARKQPVQRTLVDLNALLEETLELEGYELRKSRIAVVRHLAQDLPPILADPNQLQQVFTNLVLNAAEAMRDAHGRGTLTLATHREPGRDLGADRVVVAIGDDGPGIPARDAARIFEPFFTTKRERKGTGLGLAISRQIVENHQGRIRLESQPGAGTVFVVELLASAETRRSPTEPAREERMRGEGLPVLLVEDEGVVGDLLAEFLVLDGHQVDRAANGREALELVKGRAYALIVSDIRMPDLDGPALYRELRAARPELSRRMMFVTGDVMSAETRRFLEETGLAYLEKPFGIAEFHTAVRVVLGQAARVSRSAKSA